MNVKKIFAVPHLPELGNISILVLRVVAGSALAIHGWPKIQNPFAWMGPDAFAPAFMLGLAALSEFGGGIAWALGLLTPLASFGVMCTMAVAVWMHAYVQGDPFVAMGPGASWEPAALFLCIAFALIGVGPGRFSLDRKLSGSR